MADEIIKLTIKQDRVVVKSVSDRVTVRLPQGEAVTLRSAKLAQEHAQNAAQFAHSADQSKNESAQSALIAREAKAGAKDAQRASEAAKTKSESARNEAIAAKEASESARDAGALHRDAAEQAESKARGHEQAAGQYKLETESARDAASGHEQGAISAKSAAEAAQESAEAAQSAAETSEDKSRQHSQDASQALKDTLVARGEVEKWHGEVEANTGLVSSLANQVTLDAAEVKFNADKVEFDKGVVEAARDASAGHEQASAAARSGAESARASAESARDTAIDKADSASQSDASAAQSLEEIQEIEGRVLSLHDALEDNVDAVSLLASQVSADTIQVASDRQVVAGDRTVVQGLRDEALGFKDSAEHHKISAESDRARAEAAQSAAKVSEVNSAQHREDARQFLQEVEAAHGDVEQLRDDVDSNAKLVSNLAGQVALDAAETQYNADAVEANKAVVEGLKVETQIYRDQTEQFKNDAEAVAAASAGGLLPVGGWDASTGQLPTTPTDHTQPWYRITVAGTLPSLGELNVGDNIYWSRTFETWFAVDNTDRFTSINGYTHGNVELTTGDIPENGPLYHTQPRVRSTTLSGMSETSATKPTVSDTLLSAIGKIVSKLWNLAVGDIAGLGSMATRDAGTSGNQHRTNTQNEQKFVTTDTEQAISAAKLWSAKDDESWESYRVSPREGETAGSYINVMLRRVADLPSDWPSFSSEVTHIQHVRRSGPSGDTHLGGIAWGNIDQIPDMAWNRAQGVIFGRPTGGFKGRGSINTQKAYINGVEIFEDASGVYTAGSGKLSNAVSNMLSSTNADQIRTAIGAAESGGTVAWGKVTDKPAQATRWPSWSEVSSKPSTFSPSKHSHGFDDLPISAAQVSNWDKAFGWGDHSNAGYAKSGTGSGNVRTNTQNDERFVNNFGAQDVAGTKRWMSRNEVHGLWQLIGEKDTSVERIQFIEERDSVGNRITTTIEPYSGLSSVDWPALASTSTSLLKVFRSGSGPGMGVISYGAYSGKPDLIIDTGFGVVFGNPTGGFKGRGSINAETVYIGGVNVFEDASGVYTAGEGKLSNAVSNMLNSSTSAQIRTNIGAGVGDAVLGTGSGQVRTNTQNDDRYGRLGVSNTWEITQVFAGSGINLRRHDNGTEHLYFLEDDGRERALIWSGGGFGDNGLSARVKDAENNEVVRWRMNRNGQFHLDRGVFRGDGSRLTNIPYTAVTGLGSTGATQFRTNAQNETKFTTVDTVQAVTAKKTLYAADATDFYEFRAGSLPGAVSGHSLGIRPRSVATLEATGRFPTFPAATHHVVHHRMGGTSGDDNLSAMTYSRFDDSPDLSWAAGAGVAFGNPDGGFKGNGTTNAKKVYSNGVEVFEDVSGVFIAGSGAISNAVSNMLSSTTADQIRTAIGAAESGGTVAWGKVTDKPAQATRWPSWSEVSSKPSTFSPSKHSHGFDDLPISAAQVSNWDKAFGWGDHSNAGYAKGADLGNCVTTDTDQTITGVKTFDSDGLRLRRSDDGTVHLRFEGSDGKERATLWSESFEGGAPSGLRARVRDEQGNIVVEWRMLRNGDFQLATGVYRGNGSKLTNIPASAITGLGTMATRAAGTGSTQFRTNEQNDARFVQVYGGQAQGETQLPLGHILLAFKSGAEDVGRNNTAPVYLGQTNDSRVYSMSFNGPRLAGTWRSRGALAPGFTQGATHYLFQRVA